MDSDVGVSLHKKGRKDWRLVVFSQDRNGGSYKRVIGLGKEKSCRGEGVLLLLPFAEKCEGHGYQLDSYQLPTL